MIAFAHRPLKKSGTQVAFLARVFDFLCSLKLAVLIIIGIGIISSVGTIYEARYDAQTAQKLIYKSIYMYAIMGALVINLLAVMIDRWPWKRNHLSFVLAHIGIITLLIGSVITQKFGIDGSIAFGVGETNRYVSVDSTEMGVFAATEGTKLEPVFQKPVDFFMQPPSPEKPYLIPLSGGNIELIDYIHYGLRKAEVVRSERNTDGPAIRIQLLSSRVNMTQWLVMEGDQKPAEVRLGPAKVVLTAGDYAYDGGNVLVLTPEKGDWAYKIFTASKGGMTSSGRLQEGSALPTGWMDIELRVLRTYDHAREKVDFVKREQPTPFTVPAVKVKHGGSEYWLALNSVLKIFSQDSMVWLSYANRRIDIGFPMTLAKFKVGRYQGTNRAASYESEVEVPGIGQRLISMNEPLQHNGFTFYQSSFQEDEMGNPTASILSVNYDPGRWIKYLGSFLIVLGSIMLFYFRRKPRPASGGM